MLEKVNVSVFSSYIYNRYTT